MAKVIFDASEYQSDIYDPGVESWNHTVGAGANLLLVVVATSKTIVGVTYNGVAMTLIGTGAGDHKSYILFRPDAGTHAVILDLTGGGNHQAMSISFIGADLKVPTLCQYEGGRTGFSTTFTTADARSLCFDFVTHNAAGGSEDVTPNMTVLHNGNFHCASYLPASDPSQPWAQPLITWNLPYNPEGTNGYSTGFSIDAPPEGSAIGITPVVMI